MAIGDIEITSFKIGDVDCIDPQKIGLIGFNIYESLLKPLGAYGEVRIADFSDQLGSKNITGKEDVEISFNLPDFPNSKANYKFKLYKNVSLDDGSMNEMGSMHSKQYTMQFVSKPYIEAPKNRVSKSFNEPTHSAVEKIAKDYLKVDKIDVKAQTKQVSKIAHNENPLNVLMDYDKLHVGTDNEPLFYLFETSENGERKHVFNSMKNMMDQGPSVKLTQTSLISTGNLTESDKLNSILWFRSNNFDSSTRALSQSVQSTYNPATGRKFDPRKEKFDGKVAGEKIFEKVDGKRPVFHANNPFNEKKKAEVATSKEKRAQYLAHLTQNYAELEVPGNPNITLGSMIELDIPKKADSDNEDGEKQFNGKALVVAIRHKVKPYGQIPRYTMILRVIKGAFKEGGSENG